MKKKIKPVGTMTAIVNPFTREVKLTHKVGKEVWDLELHFDDLDEWQGFDGVDKQYDMHFYYEDYSHHNEKSGERIKSKGGFDLSVYPVVHGSSGLETDTQNSVPVKVKIDYQLLGK